jgi:hypothetical protein
VLNQMGRGRPQSKSTPDLEERVLHHIEEEPGVSTRRTAATETFFQITVMLMLHEQLLCP